MADSQDGSGSQPSTKKGRRGTRLRELTLSRSGDQRISIQFDPTTGRPLGPNKAKFSSYVALLARSKASILKKDWDDVELRVKEQIWETLLLTFDVPNTADMKRKWLSVAAERWRGFKSTLTRRYVFGDLKDVSPCSEYQFLDEDTWEKFVESRHDPAFLEKRKKGQEITAKNLYPHRLSRGGYEMLEDKMIAEKAKALEEASEADPSEVLSPPSPPKRHEKWKRARQRVSGEFTSEPSKIVAERIDSLVEQSSEGTFVPDARQDILTAAIGKPEHPGRVRAVGRGVGIRQYFGAPDTKSPISKLTRAELAVIVAHVREEVIADMIVRYPQQPTDVQPAPSPKNASTKGSCAAIDPEPSMEDIPIDGKGQCELYVEDPFHLAAIGRVYTLGPTIHHKQLDDDHVRVVVEEVKDPDAPVPIATDEVVIVEQAPGNFISWPRHLIKPLKKPPPKKQLVNVKKVCMEAIDLGDRTLQLFLEAEIIGNPTASPFYINKKDIMDLVAGTEYLNISVIQLWVRFIYNFCAQRGNLDLYGFLDPFLIQQAGNKADEIQVYIQNCLKQNKDCFFAPYIQSSHWNLYIICPKNNAVVLLCSAGQQPKKAIKDTIDSALHAYFLLKGKHSKSIKKPAWILPKSRRQAGGTECGYYVMRNMYLIVSGSITDSWKKVFDDTSSFNQEEIDDIRELWAKYLLELAF